MKDIEGSSVARGGRSGRLAHPDKSFGEILEVRGRREKKSGRGRKKRKGKGRRKGKRKREEKKRRGREEGEELRKGKRQRKRPS